MAPLQLKLLFLLTRYALLMRRLSMALIPYLMSKLLQLGRSQLSLVVTFLGAKDLAPLMLIWVGCMARHRGMQGPLRISPNLVLVSIVLLIVALGLFPRTNREGYSVMMNP